MSKIETNSNSGKLLKVVSVPYGSHEEAEDALAGVRALTGFHFGYVDPKEFRTISFHDDTEPGKPVDVRGVQRVQVATTEQSKEQRLPQGEDSADWTATVVMSITAGSPEEAAKLALDDIRDLNLEAINVDVENLGSGRIVTVPVKNA
ncbi:hypothetical protein A9R05_43070 (plasmid) [Burkholderia sp. KK1]|uniref:Uncharacterized protein n=1 Tax=Burkholderia sp. M701 TaxID=326454 RepID=V5YP42_9BURK|nr:hypothetical protein [Burkholderia sp. M701]AQH05801.1 hypothetical protein A9R05_43070 [Burkholderia sp. KK1]BAO19024.1 hypothetical protein [Burkholderia sp. M701]